ncbi:MAG TPA: hypothetical protein VJ869_13585 [Sphaerochaeta sp.]|nr:hypothetical protein [Sphaerochaeta sp.]
MYIQCTKKLLARLEGLQQKLSDLPEPLYCWHANVYDFNGVEHANDELQGLVPTDQTE